MVARRMHRLFPDVLEAAAACRLRGSREDPAGIRSHPDSLRTGPSARRPAVPLMKTSFALTLAALACCSLAHAQSAPPAPVELTAEQDQRRLLDLLHIQS